MEGDAGDHRYRSLVDQGSEDEFLVNEVPGLVKRHLISPSSMHGSHSISRPSSMLGSRLLDCDNSSTSLSSSSSQDSSRANENRDMYYSVASNMLFFTGALLQSVNAIWDLALLDADDDNDDAADDDAGGTDGGDDVADKAWENSDDIRYYISLAGAGFYILNALVEIYWARSSPNRRTATRAQDDPIPSSRSTVGFGGDLFIWSSVTFGIAAILEFVTCVFWVDDTPNPKIAIVYLIAMHTYFVSGVLDLKRQGIGCSRSYFRPFPFQESNYSKSRWLQEIGGVLFLIGCSVDVIMSYLYDPTLINVSALLLEWANLLSTILWLLNAILYLVSDCLEYSLFHALFSERRIVELLPRFVVAAAKRRRGRRSTTREESDVTSEFLE